MPDLSNLSPREKFLKIYADLPVGVRSEIIAFLPKVGPLTWNSAYVEISQNTPLSGEILKELDEMEII